VTKAITCEQRELVSSVAYRIPKFHGMTHYPHLIKKFGTPINFFGGFLESFLKEKLKRPSKQVNSHTHRLQHDILLRSYEGRQYYSLARKILFPSVYTMSLLVSDVTIISKDDYTKTILSCNPKWNKQDKSIHQSNSWFDWVEVNLESQNGKNYSVPAKLL